MCAFGPAPAGWNDDSAPASRSAQSLGRKGLPSRVMPWILYWRGAAADMVAWAGAGLPPVAWRTPSGITDADALPAEVAIVPSECCNAACMNETCDAPSCDVGRARVRLRTSVVLEDRPLQSFTAGA